MVLHYYSKRCYVIWFTLPCAFFHYYFTTISTGWRDRKCASRLIVTGLHFRVKRKSANSDTQWCTAAFSFAVFITYARGLLSLYNMKWGVGQARGAESPKSPRQPSMYRWEAVMALVSLKGILSHSYNPQGMIKAVHARLSSLTKSWWYALPWF